MSVDYIQTKKVILIYLYPSSYWVYYSLAFQNVVAQLMYIVTEQKDIINV